MLQEPSLDGATDSVVAIQKEACHRSNYCMEACWAILRASQVVEPCFEYTCGFVSIQRSATLRILAYAPKKIPLNERTCFLAFEGRLDAIPCLIGQLVQQGVNLDAVRSLDPLPNQLSWNGIS